MAKADFGAKFESFVRKIKKNDRIAMIYHPDNDGLCAAIIATKALERFGIKPPTVITQKASEIAIKPSTISRLKKMRASKVLIFDMAVDQYPGPMKSIEKFADVLIVDHHIINNDLNSKKTLMMKASFLSDIPQDQYCTTKLAYDLFGRVAEVEDLDWIAAIGIVADKGDKTWRDFMISTARKNAVNIKRFEELHEILEAARCAGARPEERYEVLKAAAGEGGIQAVINSPLRRYADAVMKEVRFYTERVRRLAEIDERLRLVWYELKPKYYTKTWVANFISSEYFPDWTVLVITIDPKSKRADISARRQDRRINMHELMKAATSGIRGACGGGHVPAAGATVPVSKLQDFKAAAIKFLNEKSVA